jgi:hypothetical protein
MIARIGNSKFVKRPADTGSVQLSTLTVESIRENEPPMKFKCPLCDSPLSESHYHKVLKIQEKKERVQKGALDRLRKQAAAAQAVAATARSKQREIRLKAKQDVEAAKRQVVQVERKKSEIRNKRLLSRIAKLEQEKEMLQRRTNPREIGLADELVLVNRLKKEFPADLIQHTGKGGDVLHFVKWSGEDAGRIVYECKHTDRISGDHVRQTALARKTRDASYGILVTTGTRKGFAGLAQDSGVFIVAQAGVITLARLCRESLVTMAKQRLDAAAREAAAKRLMDYVTSPGFKTPVEEAICSAERARNNLVREIRQHVGDWQERHELYQTIHFDVSHVQRNIGRVLDGEEPLKLEKLKLEPLALPA